MERFIRNDGEGGAHTGPLSGKSEKILALLHVLPSVFSSTPTNYSFLYLLSSLVPFVRSPASIVRDSRQIETWDFQRLWPICGYPVRADDNNRDPYEDHGEEGEMIIVSFQIQFVGFDRCSLEIMVDRTYVVWFLTFVWCDHSERATVDRNYVLVIQKFYFNTCRLNGNKITSRNFINRNDDGATNKTSQLKNNHEI